MNIETVLDSDPKIKRILETVMMLSDDADGEALVAIQNTLNAIGFMIQANKSDEEMLAGIDVVRDYMNEIEEKIKSGMNEMVFNSLDEKVKE